MGAMKPISRAGGEVMKLKANRRHTMLEVIAGTAVLCLIVFNLLGLRSASSASTNKAIFAATTP